MLEAASLDAGWDTKAGVGARVKLLFRLLFTLAIFVMLLLAIWFVLPVGLTAFARYQLEQAGFTDVVLEIDSIGLQSSRLSFVQFSSEDMLLQVQGLQLRYQGLKLLGAGLESIGLEQLKVSLKETATPGQITLPDPAILSMILGAPVAEMIPASSLFVSELLVYSTGGDQIMSAHGEIQKQGQHGLNGTFQLSNSKQDNYRLQLASSPLNGLSLELFSEQKNTPELASLKLDEIKKQGEVEGQLRLDLAAISLLLDVPTSLSGLFSAQFLYAAETGHSSKSFTLNMDGQSLLVSGWQLDRLTAQFSGELELDDKQLKLGFQAGAQVQLQGLVGNELQLSNLRLLLPETITIAQNPQKLMILEEAGLVLEGLKLGSLSIPEAYLSGLGLYLNLDAEVAEQCAFNARLDLPLVNIDAAQFELAQSQLEGLCPLTSLSWSVQALTEKLVYEDAEMRIPLNQCRFGIGNSNQGQLLDEDPAELSAEFNCESGEISEAVTAKLRMHASNGVGRAQFSVQHIQPNDTQALLASVFKQWAQPFEIVSGNIDVDGVYRWWKSSAGKHSEKLVADVKVRDAGGYYEDILFSGLNYQDSIELLPKLDSGDLSGLEINDIDIGLPVTRFRVMLGLSESGTGVLPVVTIEELSLSVLQGRISADPLVMDMNLLNQTLMLTVEGLDLQQIIGMQQLEGLSANGMLDGRMPVRLSEKGVNITGGKIYARAPGGRIQYLPQGAADISGAAPGSELLMKILEDLDYNSMSVDVNYTEDGEMDMQLSIKGLSPQVDAHRPVHFNLNLQQNLLTLLQSLRYVDGISSHIDQDVQDYFNQQKN